MTSTVIPASRENDEPISTEAIRAGPAICAALQKKGTTAQRFLQEAKLERLLENYQPSKLKQLKPNDPIWNKTFTKFETVDLVYPTPTGCHKEVATGLMTSIIMQNLDFFSTLNTEYRRMAVDAIVGHFETIGSRFLEAPPRHQVQQKRTYRLMSVPSIRTKVLYLFRINAFRARNKQRVLEDSTNNYNKKPRKTNSQRPKSQTKSLASRENLPRPPSKEVIFEETTHPTSAISSNKSVCSETESFKENQRHQKRPTSESIEIAKKSVGIESGKKNFAKQTPSFYQGPLMNYIISCRVKMRTFVCKAQLEHLMQQNTKCVLRRHDFRDEYFHTTDTNFRNVDVVFPVRDEKCPHLGNALLKYIAHQNMKFFISLETEEEMSRAMESIVAHFESIESRFLEEVSDSGHSERRVRSYRPIDYPALERKLTALFQNGGRCDPGENTREPTRKRPSSLDYYGSSPPQKKSRQSGGGSFQPSFSLNAREQLDQSLEVYLAAEKASIERFVRNADLRQLSESFNSSGSRGIPNKAWGTTIHSIRPLDVLANNHQPQLGNALLLEVLNMNVELYAQTPVRDRTALLYVLVSYFEGFGCRFLEAVTVENYASANGGKVFRSMGHRALREKLTKILRSCQFQRYGNVLVEKPATREPLPPPVQQPVSRIRRRAQVSTTRASRSRASGPDPVAVYQKTNLVSVKRGVLAPRPVFF